MIQQLPSMDPMEILKLLSSRFTEEAGQAYAKGDNQNAAAYRDAAKLLAELAEKLPPLPKNEGPTYRYSVSK